MPNKSQHELGSFGARTRALGCAVLLVGSAQAAPAFLGTWQFDPAHSSFNGGIPYSSATTRFEAVSGGIRVSVHIIEGNNVVQQFEYVDHADGSFVPVLGNPFYDNESTRWNRHEAVRTERRGQKVIGTSTMQLTSDGHSYVARADRMRPDGVRYTSIIAWNRAATGLQRRTTPPRRDRTTKVSST